ncbi:MAG: multidrug transporter, partial [Pseudomonadota bacterium]
MADYFVQLAGTQEGERLAVFLALFSAFAHAVFAALNKGGNDPYLNRGAINIAYSLMAAPFALFFLPLPESHLIYILVLSFVFHVSYEWLQAAAYYRGALTLVYPIARGTGPIIIAVISIILFKEQL